MSDLFAPEGGWRVRILDLSGGAEDNIVEEIAGFPTLMHANAFARRYVRDSVERCRVSGMSRKTCSMRGSRSAKTLSWSTPGRAVGAAGPNSAPSSIIARRPEERDWRSIDPRRMELDDDDNDDPSGL